MGVLDYKFHRGASTVLNRRRDLFGINETPLVLPTVFFETFFTLSVIKLLNMSFPIQRSTNVAVYFCKRERHYDSCEVKFGGQALLFSPVAACDTKHREYDRSEINMTEILREFISSIKQEAPPILRNHGIFKMLHASPKLYLETKSPSFCVNVTRHQPIIPYRHLPNDV